MSIKLTIDAADWQKQVNAAVKTLEKLTYHFEQEQRKILEAGAGIVVNEVQARAPIGNKIHIRYPSKPKGAPRAAKGEGRPVAKYYPGNLRRSFAVLNLRRTKDVIIGAVLAKRGGKGTFANKRADGYYLHFIEYGTEYGDFKRPARPFVRPAYISAAPKVITEIHKGCNMFAAKFARQNAL
jgi:HK97 gp10 family phage protein